MDLFEAVECVNTAGAGPVVLLCEHASAHFPERYRDLGLGPLQRVSHAAWDPGARDLALVLSAALDAPLVAGAVSRLVYDCNRPPEAASAIPERSERIDVPGNRNLSAEARAERVAQVYDPFHAAAATVLDHRRAAIRSTAVVTIHSFTRVYFDRSRPVEVGLLHDADDCLARLMFARSVNFPGRDVRLNEPYSAIDGVTHSLNRHGVANGLHNVMIEVRNDLLETPHDVDTMAGEILGLLRPALAQIEAADA